MILVDTSIWVDHFRNGNELLKRWLLEAQVVIHSYVVEELALGQLKNRTEILRLISSLPRTSELNHGEYLYLVGEHRLFGKGLSMVDVHLLGAALINELDLATQDKALMRAARAVGLRVLA